MAGHLLLSASRKGKKKSADTMKKKAGKISQAIDVVVEWDLLLLGWGRTDVERVCFRGNYEIRATTHHRHTHTRQF